MTPILDPRNGDIEDDASSTKRRSLLSLAGSLLAEISLPKLAIAWMLLIGFPGLLLGAAPLACLDLDRRGLVQGCEHLHRNLAGAAAAACSWRLAGSRAGHSCGSPKTASGR